MISVSRGGSPEEAWQPSDHGLLAWSYDPSLVVSSTALGTAGTIYTVKLKIPRPMTVSNIITVVLSAGSSLTAGQCFVSLYQNGALKGTSADQQSAWGSPGVKTAAITPVDLIPGIAIVGMWFNGTTGPAIGRGASTSTNIGNVGLSSTNSRYGTADTGRTTTAPSTLGTISSHINTYWVALS